MGQTLVFSDLLKQFIQQDGRHVRQISQAITHQFGSDHQVPHNSLSRWVRGETKRPRQWESVVMVAAVLQLSQSQLNQLLAAAGFSDMETLATDPPIPDLFALWQASVPARRPPFQVPAPPIRFIGREALLGSIKRFLGSRGQSQLCCLLGMAGLGKTSLAAQAATKLRSEFPDGVLWVALDQTDPMNALLSMADAYGLDVAPYTDLGSRSGKVREVLANKSALLVLDGATQDAELRPLLPPVGACRVLVTSRRLDLATLDEAFRIMMPPFDAAHGDSLDLFQLYLLDETMETEQGALLELADLVGHHPLALQILASRLANEPGWTASKLLDTWRQTNQPLSLLARGDLQMLPRLQASLAAVPEAEQRLFAWLGMFGGSFTAEQVATLCDQPVSKVADSLRRLHTHSLLITSSSSARYCLHPLVRLFSQSLPQPEKGIERFVSQFAQQPTATMGQEQGNVEAAIQLAVAHQLDGWLQTAVLRLAPHLQQTGQLALARRLLAQAELVARGQATYLPNLIQLLHQAGLTAMKQGLPDQADPYYQEALALAQSSGDAQQTAEILHKLSALAYRRGRMEEAAQFCQEGLAIARPLEDLTLTANLLTNLGLAEVANGRLAEAIAHYEEALTLTNVAEASDLTITLLQNLGVVYEHQGNFAQAQAHYAQGLELAKARQDPELRSRMLGNLGLVACHLGNYAEATARFRQGLALAEKNGLAVQQYRQQANLGRAALLRGQHNQANGHYREALTLVRKQNFAPDLSIILNQAGDCFLQQDAYSEAQDCYSEALQLAEANGLHRLGPIILFGLAKVAYKRGNIVEARRLGEQSRAQLAAIGHSKAKEVWWWLQELPGTAAPA